MKFRVGAFANLVLLTAISLISCSKFQSVQPPPSDIVHIRNTEVDIQNLSQLPEPIPTPLPVVPDGTTFAPVDNGANALENEPIGPKAEAGPVETLRDIGKVEEPDITVAPYRSVGRLDYANGAQRFFCTGQIVGPQGDVLLTAAHCVYNNDRSRWGSNFSFAQAFDDGTGTATFDWTCAAIFTGWTRGSYAHDYAFVHLRDAADHSLGIRINSNLARWESVGYPGKIGGGQIMKVVEGRRGPNSSAAVVQMTDNPFGGGSSGGGWLDGEFAMGVNSFKYTSDQNSMYGPAFNEATLRLYEFVSNDCQTEVDPLGTNMLISSVEPDEAYIATESRMLLHATSVVNRADDTCSCSGSEGVFVTNRYSEPYAVMISRRTFAGNQSEEVGYAEDLLSVPGNGEAFAGCTIGSPNEAESCVFSGETTILRASKINVTGGDLLDSSIRSVSPAFCEDKCVNDPTGGYCYRMGSGATSILKSLHDTYEAIVTNGTSSGVVVSKDDVIKNFGGDPSEHEDPCDRSDFVSILGNTENDGIRCRIVTPEIGEQDGQLRLSLRAQPRVSGHASATLSSQPVALFPARDKSSAVEFFGGINSDALNQIYGGSVLALSKSAGLLVATTENGCMAGDYGDAQ